MFANNSYFDNENTRRVSFGIAGAFTLHLLVLLYFMSPVSQKIIAADIFIPPTSVRINFVSPIKKQIPIEKPPEIVKAKKPVIERVVKAPVQEPAPAMLNKIEPAAIPEPPPETIPVFSKASVKGRRVQPQYPKRAIRMGQEGVVWLHVLISPNGTRQDIKVHKPSQYALLNQAALKAVRKWKFRPNFINGRAIQSWVAIPVEFKIK